MILSICVFQATETVKTNYFGTENLCNVMIPLIREGGKIVFVASESGHLDILTSDELKSQFMDPNADMASLNRIMNKFIKDAEHGDMERNGWPKNAYAVSKLGVIAYTKALARVLKDRNIEVNCFCPGYVATHMTHGKGQRSPDEGARCGVWLATECQGRTGEFFKDNAPIKW
jgi:carbonyl reductase 1